MKIAIDARFWGPTHTGLGVYTKELIRNLAKIDSQNEYYLLVRSGFVDEPIKAKNFYTIKTNAPPYTFREQLSLSWILLRLNPDLTHFPSINVPLFYFKRMIVTIHDLIKHESRGVETSTLPKPLYWLKYFVYLFLISWLVRRSDRLIVPSNTVATTLEKRYPAAKKKVVVTYEAPTIAKTIKRAPLSLPDRFAIYTGNAYPHKNLPILISAWKNVYHKTKTKLVLVCGRTIFATRIEQMVKHIGAYDWVEFKGYLTDEELAYAYDKALVYVFPTLMEGFGIPGLDAMNYSVPVLCSDLQILREIYGEAAEYFDPTSKEDLEKKAINLILSPDRRKKLVAAGQKRVKLFSWENLARETLRTYEEVVA